MPQEYARLELVKSITVRDGGSSSEVVVFRPTCRAMTEVLDTVRVNTQVERFVASCVRAVNGGTEPVEFNASELNAIDGSELSSLINEMSDEADRVSIEETGDGIMAPLIYTLQRPIKLTAKEDGETLHQLSFEGRRVGDISDFLDARGETKEFHAFMRAFAKPIGVTTIRIMTDNLIDAMDFLDYLVIRRQIMGKLVFARRRWKKAS